MKREFRVTCGGELRASADKKKIEGYAALFNSDSIDLGGFIETIRPGAFARALRERQDVRALINHDSNLLLGRVNSGTLALTEDSKGLRFVCDLPATSYARDLVEQIGRGDISGCSFGFIPKKDAWPSANRRELVDVNLIDCGPVTFPAYPETSVAARAALNPDGDPKVREVRFYPAIAATPGDPTEIERLRLRLRLSLI